MPAPTVFFDEAGNTGAALTDTTQPVFILASTDMTDDEADATLARVRTEQAREVKFTSLRKSEAGQRRLLDLIGSGGLDSKHIKSMVMHKRFMVVTKLVDIIAEPLANASGIDLYERGANIAMSNLHYYALPIYCGQDQFDEFIASFVEMIRRSCAKNKKRFFCAVRRLYDCCSDEEYKACIAPYVYAEQYIHEILNNITYLTLDPAIPSFWTHCTAWGMQLGRKFDVIHDSSKPIAAEQATLEAMMNPSIEPAVIGYDRRRFEFPLKATGITFANSLDHAALQLADVVAGATAYWASSLARGQSDELAEKLDAAGIRRFVFGTVWPSPDVTPEQLGTKEVGGINAVEYMVNALAGRT